MFNKIYVDQKYIWHTRIHIFLSESRDDNIKMKSSKLYEARVTFYLFFTCDDRFIKNIIIFLRLYYLDSTLKISFIKKYFILNCS